MNSQTCAVSGYIPEHTCMIVHDVTNQSVNVLTTVSLCEYFVFCQNYIREGGGWTGI